MSDDRTQRSRAEPADRARRFAVVVGGWHPEGFHGEALRRWREQRLEKMLREEGLEKHFADARGMLPR